LVMSNESYAKGVETVLAELEISSKHYLHLGAFWDLYN
jgi:hypothetical protein